MLTQIFYYGYEIGEISCPAKYFEEASSINFRRSMKYGLGVLANSVVFRLNKWGLAKSKIYQSAVHSQGRVEETGNFTISNKQENYPLAK